MSSTEKFLLKSNLNRLALNFDQTVSLSIQKDRSTPIRVVNLDQQPVPRMVLLIPIPPNQEMKNQEKGWSSKEFFCCYLLAEIWFLLNTVSRGQNYVPKKFYLIIKLPNPVWKPLWETNATEMMHHHVVLTEPLREFIFSPYLLRI